MSNSFRLLTVAAMAALMAACGSDQQASSSVRPPGETSGRPGLEVPPDVWAHPETQTATSPGQR